MTDKLNNKQSSNINNTSLPNTHSNEAIAEIRKNIKFLRNECASKNEIIKILLSDKTTTNSPTSSSNYVYPKKASKPPNDNNPSDIVTRNRFESLHKKMTKMTMNQM